MQVQQSTQIKGLVDYPTDVAVGVVKAGAHIVAKNDAEIQKDGQEIKDSFKATFKGLGHGDLDKAVAGAITGLTDTADGVVHMAVGTAAAIVTTLAIIPAGLLTGVDMGGKYIGDKLEGADNNYAKTLSTGFRVLFGKN